MRYVVGLQSVVPGFRKWIVLPRGLTVLDQVSVTHGASGMIVDLNMTSGFFRINSARPGRTGTLYIPKFRRSDGARLIELVDMDDPTAVHLPKHYDGDYVEVANLVCYPAWCRLRATFAAATSFRKRRSVTSPTGFIQRKRYPAKFIGHDSDTRGADWRERYGRDGFVLFSVGVNQSNVEEVPSYVSSINYFTGKPPGATTVQFPSGSYPKSAALTLSGILGAITTGNPSGMTFAIDVELDRHDWHQFSLYAVDANAGNRVQVVEIFDMATRKVISPWLAMRNFTGGAFWTWSYNASIRMRITYVRSHVDKDSAVVSGVFFDPCKSSSPATTTS